jgi:Tfp pilus assembly protein PilF
VRGILIALAVALAIALGAVQLASDAIFARAGEPASLPAHLQPELGARIYHAVLRIAPAPYAYAMLARAALSANNPGEALTYARALPNSARRDDLLGEIARANGDHTGAQRYFVRAGDLQAVSREVDVLARRDPAAAYALESALKTRLEADGTHPDAVAEAYWQLGVLAWRLSKRELGMQNYRQAVALSPLTEKYLLSAAFAAYDLHDDASSQKLFARVLNVDPASADAYAGSGLVAVRQGHRAQAQRYAQRATAINPHSQALETLNVQVAGDEVDRLVAQNKFAQAYAVEDALKTRLEAEGTHPDDLAEAYWHLGLLATRLSKRDLAMQNYRQAVALAPFSEKYLLNAAFGAYDMGDDGSAQKLFARALAVDPASADGYAGAGMVALREGHRAQAQSYARRAGAIDPHAHALGTLNAQLHP